MFQPLKAILQFLSVILVQISVSLIFLLPLKWPLYGPRQMMSQLRRAPIFRFIAIQTQVIGSNHIMHVTIRFNILFCSLEVNLVGIVGSRGYTQKGKIQILVTRKFMLISLLPRILQTYSALKIQACLFLIFIHYFCCNSLYIRSSYTFLFPLLAAWQKNSQDYTVSAREYNCYRLQMILCCFIV